MTCGRRGEITPARAAQAHRLDVAPDQGDLPPALAGWRRILRHHPPAGRDADFRD
jgi:hypothetical protein